MQGPDSAMVVVAVFIFYSPNLLGSCRSERCAYGKTGNSLDGEKIFKSRHERQSQTPGVNATEPDLAGYHGSKFRREHLTRYVTVRLLSSERDVYPSLSSFETS